MHPLTIILSGEVGGDEGRRDPTGGRAEEDPAPLILVQLHHRHLCLCEGVRVVSRCEYE